MEEGVWEKGVKEDVDLTLEGLTLKLEVYNTGSRKGLVCVDITLKSDY